MGKPAARIGDMHMCPMVTPGTPPIPHVGGPVTGPGCATVLIGGMPAAVMGDMCTCVGPPDSIILGSTGVLIGGKPAARMGDMCTHGGAITLGCPTVLIGEVSPQVVSPTTVVSEIMQNLSFENKITEAAQGKLNTLVSQAVVMQQASIDGSAFVHLCEECKI